MARRSWEALYDPVGSEVVVCQPEKRKVGSSTLPLTTGLISRRKALTCVNRTQAIRLPERVADRWGLYVTAVRPLLSHADRTTHKLLFCDGWALGMAEVTTFREVEFVTVTAFKYTFEDILPDIAQDLKTLEDEGAVYGEFADHDEDGTFLDTFTRYRIKLTPSELVEFVQATLAAQEFQKTYERTKDFTAAILAINEHRFRDRVTSYGNYGKSNTISGDMVDIRGCHASFIGPDLEELLCGHRPDRYEPAPLLGTSSNKNELVISALRSVAVSAMSLL